MILGGLIALGGAVGLVLAIIGMVQPFNQLSFGYFTFAAVLLAGLGLAIIGFGMSLENKEAKTAPLLIGILCLCTSFPGFLITYVSYSKDTETYQAQFRTKCVPAQIISSHLYESGKTGSRNYYYSLEYSFTVDGSKYTESDSVYKFNNQSKYKVCYQPGKIYNHNITEDINSDAK